MTVLYVLKHNYHLNCLLWVFIFLWLDIHWNTEIFPSMKSCLCQASARQSSHPSIVYFATGLLPSPFQRKKNKKITVVKTSRILGSLLRQPLIQLISWNMKAKCCHLQWMGWKTQSSDLPLKMLSHAEAKPQSSLMLLPAQASPCCTEDPGNHLGHFAGILAHAFLPLVWAKACYSLQYLPFDPFPRALVVYVIAQRGRWAWWQRLFDLCGTIPFNTKCSVGKPHGSSFFLIKSYSFFAH